MAADTLKFQLTKVPSLHRIQNGMFDPYPLAGLALGHVERPITFTFDVEGKGEIIVPVRITGVRWDDESCLNISIFGIVRGDLGFVAGYDYRRLHFRVQYPVRDHTQGWIQFTGVKPYSPLPVS